MDGANEQASCLIVCGTVEVKRRTRAVNIRQRTERENMGIGRRRTRV
jgi:hypothetical protein